MLKFILLLGFVYVYSYASQNNAFLYKVEKDNKKLGHYTVVFNDEGIESKSYAASNRLKMFSSKKIVYLGKSIKAIAFTKGKTINKYNVTTNMDAIDKVTYKKFERKFKKVKGREMLFMTKDGKGGIELFNKRPIVIKTLDELLVDIYSSSLKYEKFILFDKLGVMKMIAKIQKVQDGIIIQNASKKKDYMKITIKNNVPIMLKSIVSNWKIVLVKNGKLEKTTIDLNQLFIKGLKEKLDNESKDVDFELSQVKQSKSFYEVRGKLKFSLPDDMQGDKSYKQKGFCKKVLKKMKLKSKMLKIQNGSCISDIKSKVKTKDIKKHILNTLGNEYPQLKITKEIEFRKNNIVYGVIK